MSTNEFAHNLQRFEQEGIALPAEDAKWLAAFNQAVREKGEEEIREQLDDFYEHHKKDSRTKVIRLWAVTGIAATLLVAGFYLTSIQRAASGNSIELQIQEAPIYSDSARYDSTKTQKNLKPDVDK